MSGQKATRNEEHSSEIERTPLQRRSAEVWPEERPGKSRLVEKPLKRERSLTVTFSEEGSAAKSPRRSIILAFVLGVATSIVADLVLQLFF